MDVIIRKMTPCQEDVEGLLKIDQETFNECTYTWTEVLDKIDFDQYPIYLAQVQGNIVGFIGLMKVQTLHYSGMWIDLIGVLPAYQGCGIGKKLIQSGQALAKELGVDFSSALIREDNTSSIGAFESEGFEWDKKNFRLYFKA